MPDSKISALPAATTPLAGTEETPIVQSGTTDRVTVANLTAGRAVGALSFTATGGTVTASAPVFDATQTWNNAGVAFTGIKLNATQTAAAAGSRLMDLQLSGTTRFSVANDGSAVSNNAIRGGNDASVFSLGASNDVVLARDAANTLAQRNGANAQAFRVYNTRTDDSNFERVALRFNSNNAQLLVEVAGTGTGRALQFGVGGAAQWQINTNGHLTTTLTNTYDIGATADALSPRNVYAATGFFVGTATGRPFMTNAGTIGFAGRGYIAHSGTDGVFALYNAAGTDFGRLQFGGTTSSFPALKRSAASLQVKLADDSAFAELVAGGLQSTGGFVYFDTKTASSAALRATGTNLSARLGDNSAFTNIQGKLTTETNYTAGAIVPTGYLTLYDATGTAYRVPCVV